MGLHDRDGELDDMSRQAIEDKIGRIRGFITELEKIDKSQLSLNERVDLDVVKADFELTIRMHEQIDNPSINPTIYPALGIYGVHSLFSRISSPDESRIAAGTERLRKFRLLLRQGKENLKRPPRIFTEIALDQIKGSCGFLMNSIPKIAEKASKGGEELLAANDDAIEALTDYRSFLEEEILPRSDGEFAIGRDLFELKLRLGHFLDLDLDTLLEIGKETLARTKDALAAAAANIDSTKSWQDVVENIKSEHPPADELKETYQRYMQQAKQFVIDKGLVDIPDGEELRVIDTPEPWRPIIPYAAYNMPGPYEKEQVGLFYVTPVGQDISAEAQEMILRDHSIPNIKVVALHEAYPGHHLQLVCANKWPDMLRHFFHNTVFVEGWALYCEELMREQGFLSDTKSLILQLKAQLWRACRVVIDASIHTKQMSYEDGVKFLMDEALLAKPNAIAEVRRYTTTPTQPLSYLIGKAEILKLKKRVESEMGPKFNLREFHNRLISFGSLPTKFIAELILQ
ncbi:MAG: DUF885 domain-containing protein [Candidatus Coatesbacteria bacterium]|nr:DUF885 domain-containing protein [Candidatus Coatesbacteria bacterium]